MFRKWIQEQECIPDFFKYKIRARFYCIVTKGHTVASCLFEQEVVLEICVLSKIKTIPRRDR